MIDTYAEDHASETGTIGDHVTIINTGTIKNVRIGSYCTIDGTSRLENGSINSNEHDPVVIGHNVMAEDFIISSGAHVSDGVVMMRCFIGQACHLSHLFSSVIVKEKTEKPARSSPGLIPYRCINRVF